VLLSEDVLGLESWAVNSVPVYSLMEAVHDAAEDEMYVSEVVHWLVRCVLWRFFLPLVPEHGDGLSGHGPRAFIVRTIQNQQRRLGLVKATVCSVAQYKEVAAV
jgi:hypothetical protein